MTSVKHDAVLVIDELPALREGITFRFRGTTPDENGDPTGDFVEKDLIVPPLNFDGLKRLQKRLARMATEVNAESVETVIDAIELALRRNYRGVPRWLIEQTIDLANMPEFTLAFMDVSGLRRKEIEAGKAKAATASP